MSAAAQPDFTKVSSRHGILALATIKNAPENLMFYPQGDC